MNYKPNSNKTSRQSSFLDHNYQNRLRESQRGNSSLENHLNVSKSLGKFIPGFQIPNRLSKLNLTNKTNIVPLPSQTNTDRWFNKDKVSEASRKCQNIFRSLNFKRKDLLDENGVPKSYSKKDLDVIINKTCQYEDNRLESILFNIIETKKNNKLPKLTLSHRKIECSSINKFKGLTKYMGENYDPYNYLVTITKPNNCILLKRFGKS